MAPDVRLIDVVKEFPETRAVDGISLEIPLSNDIGFATDVFQVRRVGIEPTT